MRVQVEWSREIRDTLVATFRPDWVVDDCAKALQIGASMVSDRRQSFAIIAVFQGEFHLPPQILPQLSSMGDHLDPRVEIMVLVLDWRDSTLYYNLFRRVSPDVARRVAMVKTPRAALERIAVHRQSNAAMGGS